MDLLTQPYAEEEARDAAVTKDTTLNALIRAFPEAHSVLRAFRLDGHGFMTDTLEEAAWYHGVDVETLLAALKHVLAARER